jgi:hypothetical protein
LSRAERVAIPDGAIAASLQALAGAVAESIMARQRRAEDFASALAKWRTRCAGRFWLDALAQLEADALRQRQEVEARCAVWDREWNVAVEQLRTCLDQIRTVLHPYDSLLETDSTVEEVAVRLTRAQRESIDLRGVEAALVWLRENWPAPSERVEAVFALWEIGAANAQVPVEAV